MNGLLFVVLDVKASCTHISEFRNEIIFKDRVFYSFDDQDYSGFYDWMRGFDHSIMGVRYMALDGFDAELISVIKKLKYVKIVHEKIIEVNFSEGGELLDDERSNDQDFGMCKVYRSPDNIFGILLDAEYLSPDEFATIVLSV